MEQFQEQNMHNEKVVRISKKKFTIWIIFLIIIVIGGWFFARPLFYSVYDVQRSASISVPSVGSGGGDGHSAPAVQKGVSFREDYPYPYPRPSPTPDITDTREFLKTDYSANIETRDVPTVVEGVEDAIKRVDGRVDNISSSEKYGRISFVIPEDELSEFRDEIEELVHEKLYVETITSTNLLTQKQDIERRTEDTVKSLGELEQEKDELDNAHTARLGTLQSQIDAFQNQLTDIRSDIANLDKDDEDYEDDLAALRAQETLLAQQVNNLLSERTQENRMYTQRSNVLITLINERGGQLELLAEEDTEFMDNIATVNGHVTVRWINLWDMGNRFSPTPMWLNTIVVVILIIWYLKRRRVIPRVEWI